MSEAKNLAIFYRQLAMTLNAGIGMQRAVSLTRKAALSPRLQRTLAKIEPVIATGRPLSDGLVAFPRVFPRLDVALVRAGERSGRLVETLNRAADGKEFAYGIKLKFASALVYPGFLLLVGLAVSGLWRTGLEVLAAVVAVQMLITHWEPAAMAWDALKLKLPLIGGVAQKNAAAQFARAFADLHDTGVSPAEAMEEAAMASGNRAMARRLMPAAASLRRGDPVAVTLRRTGALPETALVLVSVGEESGALGTSIRKAAEFLRQEAEHTQRRSVPMVAVGTWGVAACLIAIEILKLWGAYGQTISNASGP